MPAEECGFFSEDSTMATAQAALGLRIEPQELKARLDAGEQVTILDCRAPDAYDASNQRIPGDIRVLPEQLRIDANWPKDQLTVAYCT
jgi:rhodanese-related sulfurtransferase